MCTKPEWNITWSDLQRPYGHHRKIARNPAITEIWPKCLSMFLFPFSGQPDMFKKSTGIAMDRNNPLPQVLPVSWYLVEPSPKYSLKKKPGCKMRNLSYAKCSMNIFFLISSLANCRPDDPLISSLEIVV